MHKEMVDPTTKGVRDPHEGVTPIEIDVHGRWDALALSELLAPFHSFLVQHDCERWVIHARAPGCHGESLSEALAAIEDWCSGRQLRAASCRVGGRPYHLRETRDMICADCGFGAVVATRPARCPMCGGRDWRERRPVDEARRRRAIRSPERSR